MRGIFVFSILSFYSIFCHAQDDENLNKKDTLKIQTKYTTLSGLKDNQIIFKNVDTSLDFLHEYDPIIHFDDFYVTSGNILTPYQNLRFSFNNNLGLEPDIFDFSSYFFNADNIQYYDTWSPYTKLFYTQGNKEMQILKVLHSRNIHPLWNITLAVNTLSSEGLYSHQATHFQSFNASSNYHSRNKKYYNFTTYFFNKTRQNCNGGISDPDFEMYSWPNRLVSEIKLEEAEQEFRNSGISMFHYLSIDTSLKKNKFNIAHQLDYSLSRYKYSDTDPLNNYYKNILFDSNKTNDSFSWSLLNNKIYVFNHLTSFTKILYNAGFKHQSFVFHGIGEDTNMFAFNTFIDLKTNFKKINFNLNAEYVLSGQSSGNYLVSLGSIYNLSKSISINLCATAIEKYNPYIYQKITLNSLKWDNHFPTVSFKNIQMIILSKKHKLEFSANYYNIYGFTYFNSSVIPVFHDDIVNITTIQVKKRFVAGKFNLNNNILFQYTDQKKIIPLPLWSFNQTAYFQFSLVKNRLKTQIGYTFRLHDKFYMNSYYAPANIFYQQDSVEVGLYPQFDIFINGSIKKSTFFLKFEHLHQWLYLPGPFLMPFFPSNPFCFRFGVSWMFFD